MRGDVLSAPWPGPMGASYNERRTANDITGVDLGLSPNLDPLVPWVASTDLKQQTNKSK